MTAPAASAEPLAALIAAGRAAWPAVVLSDAAFAAHLAGFGETTDLAGLRGADLWLAAGAAAADSAALLAIDGLLGPLVDEVHRRLVDPPLSRDELAQAVRARVLVADDGPPRIAGYHGRGSLAGWLRMVAARVVVDEARRRQARPERPVDDAVLVRAVGGDDDPELAYLKATARRDVQAAFAEAIATLSPRERTLLRLRYLEGLEVGELAALEGLHRGSVSRTLGRVQRALLEQVRLALARDPGRTTDEVDELLGLVRSRLDVSLSRLLRDGATANV